jgi:hypothetical protein
MHSMPKHKMLFGSFPENTIPSKPAASDRCIFFSMIRCLLLMFFTVVLTAFPAFAEISPIQSSARPFGLDIVGPVHLAGSDADSALFQSDALPTVTDWININLGEQTAIEDTSNISLDPSNLYLATESDVRVYFVGEGAGYHNTLGFNADGGGITSGDPKLIFPDASSTATYYNSGDSSGTQTSSYPLAPGDFVDIGTFESGAQLDFFLIANGANGGTNLYSTDSSVNQDGIDHVVAYALEDSPYLLIGFEDLYGGGDRDFNDLLFVVDIGSANVNALTNAPEPSTMMILGSFILFSIYLKRRQNHFKPVEART